ncbi:MAG TPA: family 10 glycosylhydrolase [Candidatus Sumerlaeota bacterium]|nr:family 10 glycosylhydrolase [Candidatus Sumerlaeota bacterium]
MGLNIPAPQPAATQSGVASPFAIPGAPGVAPVVVTAVPTTPAPVSSPEAPNAPQALIPTESRVKQPSAPFFLASEVTPEVTQVPAEVSPALSAPKMTPPDSTPNPVASSVEPAPAAVSSEPEFRAVWLTRYEWPDVNSQTCRQNIIDIMDKLAAANFNVVFFQVRGQGDVLYRSPFEPWSISIGGKDPGFDPLELAINEAHSRGMQLHAYINVYPVWQGQEEPPHTTPEHPYWLYCTPSSNPNWACMSVSGDIMKPNPNENDNYVYFSPGIPDVSAYIRKITMDVIQRYDLDGIHYDRIRYPHQNYSHDPVSQSRFNGPGGNPAGLSWEDWQRDQVTRFLNDIYGAVAEVKPNLTISVSGWGIYNKNRIPGYDRFSSGYHQYYQDTFDWMQKGVIDALCPMIYWDIKDPKPNFDELAKDFLENSHGRYVYPANYVNHKDMNVEEMIAQIRLTRQLGGKGNVGFSARGFVKKGFHAGYVEKVYQNRVPVPEMLWKTQPQSGIVVGYVTDANGLPVVDAHIRVEGRDEISLSSADGFFSALNVNPAENIRIQVKKDGLGEAFLGPFSLEAGQVQSMNIRLGE